MDNFFINVAEAYTFLAAFYPDVDVRDRMLKIVRAELTRRSIIYC